MISAVAQTGSIVAELLDPEVLRGPKNAILGAPIEFQSSSDSDPEQVAMEKTEQFRGAERDRTVGLLNAIKAATPIKIGVNDTQSSSPFCNPGEIVGKFLNSIAGADRHF
jgi:hypothetical protein